jgi:hypothetical protein
MRRVQQAIGVEYGRNDPALTDKPVYRDQALADGIDGEEKTFESDGAEQGWTLRRNKAWCRDFIAIQSQPRFCHGPNVSLSACDHDALRAGGFQLKPFRQRSWHHAKRSAGVHKKLNFFNTSRRTGQMALYVEQSHIESLLESMAIVAQPTNNATSLTSRKKVAKPGGTGKTADKVQAENQSKSGQADRPDDSAKCAGASGQGNSVRGEG